MPDSVPWAGGDDRQFGETQNNAVREVDAALHPDGSNLLHVMMKSRQDSKTKAEADLIMAMGIRRGEWSDNLKQPGGKRFNAASALLMADAINSYGQDGKSRDELLEGLSSIPLINRRPASGPGIGELGT